MKMFHVCVSVINKTAAVRCTEAQGAFHCGKSVLVPYALSLSFVGSPLLPFIFKELANYSCSGWFCAVSYLSLIREWAVVSFIFVNGRVSGRNARFCVKIYCGHFLLVEFMLKSVSFEISSNNLMCWKCLWKLLKNNISGIG